MMVGDGPGRMTGAYAVADLGTLDGDNARRMVGPATTPTGERQTFPNPSSPLTGKWSLAYTRIMTDLYAALADATRRAILDELTERDGQTLFELCARLTMRRGLTSSRQAISQHLAVLEAAGLVTARREGRYKFHFVDTGPLRAIVERWPIKEREGG